MSRLSVRIAKLERKIGSNPALSIEREVRAMKALSQDEKNRLIVLVKKACFKGELDATILDDSDLAEACQLFGKQRAFDESGKKA